MGGREDVGGGVGGGGGDDGDGGAGGEGGWPGPLAAGSAGDDGVGAEQHRLTGAGAAALQDGDRARCLEA